jgi:hypothetical protein
MYAFNRYGVQGEALPPPGVPFRRDPSLSGNWVSPSKEFFFNLPTRAQQDLVSNANQAMNQAIQQLMSVGIMPRWILQTANRFVAQAMQLPEPPMWTVWDAEQPSSVSPDDPSLAMWVWNGVTYVPSVPLASMPR